MARTRAQVHGRCAEGRLRGVDKQAIYSTVEVMVSGDLAYESGTPVQTLRPKSAALRSGRKACIFGFTRGDGVWQIARIAGMFKPAVEPAEGTPAGER